MRLLKKLNIMSTMNLICCWMRLEMKWAVNTKAPMRNCDQPLTLTSLKLQHIHFRSAAILCNPHFFLKILLIAAILREDPAR